MKVAKNFRNLANLNNVKFLFQILGLISALDKTILSFGSKNTKENLRQLLISYGNAIVAVIKERQLEVSCNHNNNASNYHETGEYG